MQKYAQLSLLIFGLLLNVYIQAASTNNSIAGLSVETIQKLDENEIARRIINYLESKKLPNRPFEMVHYSLSSPLEIVPYIDDALEIKAKHAGFLSSCINQFKNMLAPGTTAKKPLARPTLQELPEYLQKKTKQKVRKKIDLYPIQCILNYFYCTRMQTYKDLTKAEELYLRLKAKDASGKEINRYLTKIIYENYPNATPYIVATHINDFYECIKKTSKIAQVQNKEILSLKKLVATFCAKKSIDTSCLPTPLLSNTCLERPHRHRRFLSKALQAICKRRYYDSRVQKLYGYIYRNYKLDDKNLAKIIIDLHEESYSDISPFAIARSIDQAREQQGYEPIATFNLAHIPHYLQKIITKPVGSSQKKLAKQLSFLQMKTCARSKGEELYAKMHLPIYYGQNEEEVVDSAIQDLASLVKEVVAKANPSAHPYIITNYIDTLLENIEMVPKKSSCTQNKELSLEHKPRWLKPPNDDDDKEDYADFLELLYCAQILSNNPTKAETLFCKACLHISTVENEPKDFFWPHLKLKDYCWLFKENKNKVSKEEVQKIFETIKKGKKQTTGPLSLKKQIACVVAKHNVNVSKMQKLLFYGTCLEKI